MLLIIKMGIDRFCSDFVFLVIPEIIRPQIRGATAASMRLFIVKLLFYFACCIRPRAIREASGGTIKNQQLT